jgi:septum formation protein
MSSLWLAEHPLLLASKSRTRRKLLEAAGIPVDVEPAFIDERAVEKRAGVADAGALASLLAREKARAVAATRPGRLVLGADQTLALAQKRFSKACDRAAAREQLRALRGKTHSLHSAIAVARGAEILFEHVDAAHLTMRAFSDAFLEGYLDAIGEAAMASVGAYQLEGAGIQLFERVEGDHFTILGLPLLPLLAWLRQAGLLAS